MFLERITKSKAHTYHNCTITWKTLNFHADHQSHEKTMQDVSQINRVFYIWMDLIMRGQVSIFPNCVHVLHCSSTSNIFNVVTLECLIMKCNAEKVFKNMLLYYCMYSKYFHLDTQHFVSFVTFSIESGHIIYFLFS